MMIGPDKMLRSFDIVTTMRKRQAEPMNNARAFPQNFWYQITNKNWPSCGSPSGFGKISEKDLNPPVYDGDLRWIATEEVNMPKRGGELTEIQPPTTGCISVKIGYPATPKSIIFSCSLLRKIVVSTNPPFRSPPARWYWPSLSSSAAWMGGKPRGDFG